MIIQTPGINGLGKTKGCEKAPREIAKKLNLKTKKIRLNNENIEDQEKQIYNQAKKYLDKHPVFLGGDHSISYPLSKAFFDSKKQPALLVFDAHPDLMKPMKNPTHEEWLRAIFEKGLKNIMVVGVRRNSENVDRNEIKFAKQNSIKIIYSDEFDSKINEIKTFCNNKNIYLSLDLDVFDESIVKSTGYPEKDGLREKQVFSILESLKNKISLVDIVEYNPEIKGNEEIVLIKKILKLFKNEKS